MYYFEQKQLALQLQFARPGSPEELNLVTQLTGLVKTETGWDDPTKSAESSADRDEEFFEKSKTYLRGLTIEELTHLKPVVYEAIITRFINHFSNLEKNYLFPRDKAVLLFSYQIISQLIRASQSSPGAPAILDSTISEELNKTLQLEKYLPQEYLS
ncbi:hypothetical protein IJG20_01460 [Candidatus Saccharibacteria bacterium]|nr:hypothetical protein [Candidatus Saccharibacteria bacterium]